MNVAPDDDITMLTILPGTGVIDRQGARTLLKDKNYRRNARHMKPLLESVRDFACSMLMVFQGRHPHDVPQSSPWIVMLGDDTFAALGPDAFHGPSLDALIAAADRAVIVSSGPEQHAYNVAATHAARDRRNVILIETLPHQQNAWVDRLKAGKPDISTLLCVPFEEGWPT